MDSIRLFERIRVVKRRSFSIFYILYISLCSTIRIYSWVKLFKFYSLYILFREMTRHLSSVTWSKFYSFVSLFAWRSMNSKLDKYSKPSILDIWFLAKPSFFRLLRFSKFYIFFILLKDSQSSVSDFRLLRF